MVMTRSDSSVAYEPDGIQERYAVPFPIFSADSVRAVLVEGHAETPLTGFSVEGMETESGVYLRFFTPPAGQKLVIYRWTKRVQETDYPEGGRFPSKTVEQDFDKLTAMAQEEEDLLATVLRVPRDFGQTPAEYLAAFFHAGEEAISANDTAQEAAKSASSSALKAESSEKNAAASASYAAQSANEAAESLLRGMPDASETQKGALRIAAREEAETRKTAADGPAALVPESLFDATETRTGLAKGDEVTVKTGPGGVLSVPGAFAGDIRLLPYRVEDLAKFAPGWYFANGDQYPLESLQGKALNKLPENYKADWNIAVTSVDGSDHISLPSLFHADGRGLFIRSVNGANRLPGSIENDTFQTHGHSWGGVSNAWGNGSGSGGVVWGSHPSQGTAGFYVSSPNSGNYGTETTPANTGMTPAIFLGA